MNSVLLDIEACIVDALKVQGWSDIPDPNLKPLLSLEKGDLGSDVCLKLAARYRRPPRDFFKVLESALRDAELATCDFEKGFFLIRLIDRHLSNGPLEMTKTFSSELQIILPAMHKRQAELAMLRLRALALVQASLADLLGVGYKIICGQETYTDLSQMDEILYYGSEKGNSQSEVLGFLLQNLEDKSDCLKNVHLLPDSLSKEDFRYFYTDFVLPSERLILSCPNSEWVRPPCRELRVPRYEISDRVPVALYFASGQPADSLDFQVPRLAEGENLYWLLGSVLERLKMTGLALEPVTDLESLAWSTDMRSLQTRQLFLWEACKSAVFDGKVPDFLSFLDDLLVRSISLCNSPESRLRSSSVEKRTLEMQILSGIFTLLSDMIDRWPLVSGIGIKESLYPNACASTVV